tara:strand:+ start:1162 stop:1476 length:315 start_codon:yes stop_codon:yes gene_type:complete
MITSEDQVLKAIIDNQEKEEYTHDAKHKYDKEYVFNILGSLKDKRIAKVFELRYFENFEEKQKPTWSFIAKKIKTSTQTAINLHQRGKKILKKKIKATAYQDLV